MIFLCSKKCEISKLSQVWLLPFKKKKPGLVVIVNFQRKYKYQLVITLYRMIKNIVIFVCQSTQNLDNERYTLTENVR